jgi:hypothetical protein
MEKYFLAIGKLEVLGHRKENEMNEMRNSSKSGK